MGKSNQALTKDGKKLIRDASCLAFLGIFIISIGGHIMEMLLNLNHLWSLIPGGFSLILALVKYEKSQRGRYKR